VVVQSIPNAPAYVCVRDVDLGVRLVVLLVRCRLCGVAGCLGSFLSPPRSIHPPSTTLLSYHLAQ